MDAGIQVIYQEFRHNLFPQLTVAENLYAGDRSGRHGRVWSKRTRMVQDAAELLAGLGMYDGPHVAWCTTCPSRSSRCSHRQGHR